MFCIGICDDDEGLCGELEKMLYDYGKENKLQMNIDIWYQGESLCRFLSCLLYTSLQKVNLLS